MTKAEEIATAMPDWQKSVLFRMERDYAIAPGAWTVPEYEFIEMSGKLFRPVFIDRDKGWGHMLTAFGKRVQDGAKADAPPASR